MQRRRSHDGPARVPPHVDPRGQLPVAVVHGGVLRRPVVVVLATAPGYHRNRVQPLLPVLLDQVAQRLIAAVARQAPEGDGRIVAFTSDHVVDNLPYGASKGALDRIVIAAARELGHLGVTANLINPGPVDTGWMTDEVRAHLTAMQPTGRLGTPDDAARLVGFLLSPDGRWISGQLLTSDGGFSV